MKIQKKIIILNKILPKKEWIVLDYIIYGAVNFQINFYSKKEWILLDYVSFSEKEDIDGDDLYQKREQFFMSQKDIWIKFYVHLPFCATICKYCMYDTVKFESVEKVNKYVDDLILFLERYKSIFSKVKFNWIFVWWWTPSILNEQQINKLFSYIFSNFSFKEEYYKEFELNPSSTTFGKLELLSKLWFDRISFWVQSFNKNTLKKEDRKYVSEKKVLELVEYAKKLNFLDINIDIIAWLNDEKYNEILDTFSKVKDISPYSVTVYTILKDLERSILFKKSLSEFYEIIDDIYTKLLVETKMLENYYKEDWNKVLWFTLKKKNHQFNKVKYDAHAENIESLFWVWFKSFWKIWWFWTYETTLLEDKQRFSFNNLDAEQEFYSSFLQSFQFRIEKKYFLDSFWIDVEKRFRGELDYLLSKKLIKENDKEIVYIWDKSLTWYYWILFLDLKNLVKFVKYRFYGKKKCNSVN